LRLMYLKKPYWMDGVFDTSEPVLASKAGFFPKVPTQGSVACQAQRWLSRPRDSPFRRFTEQAFPVLTTKLTLLCYQPDSAMQRNLRN
jgi:hypothetical protein